jgi:pyruvate/2-oxoglutarate dehydrogenase complex dihydrolipoamide dehydrogenase (E3) component
MTNSQESSLSASGRAAIEEFDVVIIGSGEGSKYLAWNLSRQGQRIAVVERKYIGGSCPNIACLPSKNVVHSAKIASYFRRSAEFGIVQNGFTVDMQGVRNRKRDMVSKLVDIHIENFRQSGAQLILGSATFVAPKIVEATLHDGTTRRLRGRNIVIGTGSRAQLPPIAGLIDAQPMTHVEALELGELPQHLLVLGGGYVGLEFAQAMRRLGSRVTVFDHNDRLVHREDADVTEGLSGLFADEGIELALGSKIERVAGMSGQSVEIFYKQSGVEKSVKGSHLLVATGRTPNTEGLGLELAGVDLTDKGYIKVDERLETTAPGVWAIGDSTGDAQFTHISYDDYRIIRDNLAGGNHVKTGRQVPFCMFTDPEFARIGLSETEARALHIPYRLFKLPMAAVMRTRTLSETRGFMKALVDVESDRILGFTVFGVDGGELMGSVQIAMIAGLPYTALRDAILAHPTLQEGLVALFSSTPTSHGQASV